MKSALLVIAPTMFRDEEYAHPKEVLEQRGVQVTTASARAGTCLGKLGMRAEAELGIAEALGRPWDTVAFIGGAGASAFFDDPTAHALAREVAEKGGVVSAICIAPSILARAGLLDGARATSFASQRQDLTAHGALWDDGPVAVHGRIVTANGPDAAIVFGQRIAELLEA